MTSLRAKKAAALLCVLYFLAGTLWIDKPGLQEDEVLFAQGLYGPDRAALSTRVFGRHVPLMQLSYLGSLKSWLWAPMFRAFGTSPAVVRLPAVAAGALTIWLVFLIVARVASPFAALASAALLAFDPLFLWLTRCDWGPVALEHLLAAGGVWLLIRFHDTRRDRWLALAFFAFGLAFWNKATFAWMAFGLLCGAFLVRRVIIELATPRRVALALCLLLLGAYPAIRFNVKYRGETLDRTASFEFSRIAHKAGNLRYTLDGVGIAGFLYRDGPSVHPWELRRGFAHWLFGAALIASPFLGAAGRCTALVFLGAFGLMAITREAGESTHHLTLLWPLPHILMGLALGRLFSLRLGLRVMAALVLAALCGTSAAVTATHYAQLSRNGSDPPWSEAIVPLARSMERAVSSGTAARILVMDWGILGAATLLTDGRLPLVWAADRESVQPGDVMVAHAANFEQFQGRSASLRNMADAAGCRLVSIDSVRDRTGEEVFQLRQCKSGE